MSISTPSKGGNPTPGFQPGLTCGLYLDDTTKVGEIYEIPEAQAQHSIGDIGDPIPELGPVTFTIDMQGPKIPFRLTTVTRDDTSGFPGPETTTNYDMGPSLTSASITLTDDNVTLVSITASRRF